MHRDCSLELAWGEEYHYAQIPAGNVKYYILPEEYTC